LGANGQRFGVVENRNFPYYMAFPTNLRRATKDTEGNHQIREFVVNPKSILNYAKLCVDYGVHSSPSICSINMGGKKMINMVYPVIVVSTLLTASVMYPDSVTASSANSPQSERVYRKTANGKGALTPKMIEGCIALKKEIDDTYNTIPEIQEQYKAEEESRKEIGLLLDEIKKQKNFDPSDNQELEIYNEKTKQYNEKLMKEKELINILKKKKEEYGKLTSKFDSECKNQPYYEDDYAAAVKKTGKSL
jgi:hypothetical protein